MTDNFNMERQLRRNAQRGRLRAEQDQVIDVSNAKRRLGTEKREKEEARRKALFDACSAAKAKKDDELAAAAARRHRVWFQTQFAAQHAAKMNAQK